ncbi:MAG: hypothetical protein U5L11_03500 [Arhodomonas sp.]|nr:hypothetical protein [Arhodomonas sp.]
MSLQSAASLGPFDAAKTMWLFLVRFRVLWGMLKRKDGRLKTRWLDTFCMAYAYLVYFERVLRAVRPEIVLVSNDHNVANRSLVALARFKGIKTAYIQHASVSSIFPALGFDYSFLDGPAALHVYQQCENNRPSDASWPKQRYVFLSGQKKRLPSLRDKASSGAIGLALNALDDPADIAALIKRLTDAGCQIRVRWHPGIKGRSLEPLKKILEAYPQVAQSDPSEESVGRFLEQVDMLVAGNSSIHLEAALARVAPIHFEMSASGTPDYYGYVEHGLSRHADNLEDLVDLVDGVLHDGQPALNPSAIRYYSATFDTEWHGREGELVAKHLVALIEGAEPSALWGSCLNLGQSNLGFKG